MERNDQWMQEIEGRKRTYNAMMDDAYMTQEVFDWNQKFIDEYNRLNTWISEDGTMRYTVEYIAKALGLKTTELWQFRANVRRQMRAYTLKRFTALYEAGKSASEIAAEMDKTDKWVEMMIERYCN